MAVHSEYEWNLPSVLNANFFFFFLPPLITAETVPGTLLPVLFTFLPV